MDTKVGDPIAGGFSLNDCGIFSLVDTEGNDVSNKDQCSNLNDLTYNNKPVDMDNYLATGVLYCYAHDAQGPTYDLQTQPGLEQFRQDELSILRLNKLTALIPAAEVANWATIDQLNRWRPPGPGCEQIDPSICAD